MQDKNPHIKKLVKSLTEQKRKNIMCRNMKHDVRRNLIFLFIKHGQHKEDDHTKPEAR